MTSRERYASAPATQQHRRRRTARRWTFRDRAAGVLYVSLEGFSRDLQVELVDNAGNIVRRASTRVRVVDQGDVLYAVITQSPLGAVDLTGVQPGIASAHQVTWQPDDLPPLAEALAGLDVMLFHDVDTGALSTDQVRTVERWVRSGASDRDRWGYVAAHDRRLSGNTSATLQGTAPLADSAALAEYLRTDPDEPERGDDRHTGRSGAGRACSSTQTTGR